MMEKKTPTLDIEKSLWEKHNPVVSIDEVGRGCWAGDVYVGAVIIPKYFDGAVLSLVRDSKVLSSKKRTSLDILIRQQIEFVSIGSASSGEINLFGINQAISLAAQRAISTLPEPMWILSDAGLKLPESFSQKTTYVIDGDKTCLSISCASIVAKVARDNYMVEMSEKYPNYGFSDNKGYGTQAHIQSLYMFGACEIHRNYRPVTEIERIRKNV